MLTYMSMVCSDYHWQLHTEDNGITAPATAISNEAVLLAQSPCECNVASDAVYIGDQPICFGLWPFWMINMKPEYGLFQNLTCSRLQPLQSGKMCVRASEPTQSRA